MLKISSFITSYMPLLVIVVAVVAFFLPASFVWIDTSAITILLGVVMFGMGLTLKPSDFKPVFTHPREIIIGELAQFIIMPMLAWLICIVLNLPQELAVGVILVGCCPGGTASNLICYLAGGDVALSVGMTAVSTLLAPFVTPALVLLFAGEVVDVNVVGMFFSIIEVVIIPIIAGFAFNHYCPRLTSSGLKFMPMVSTLTVITIVGIVVSHNASNIMSCSFLVAIAIILHNSLGLALGYLAALIARLKRTKRIAISIEVGMQNSGLATSLAVIHFAQFPLAAVPGAIFSVWHNVSGSVLAGWLKSKKY